jgi:SLOG-like protein
VSSPSEIAPQRLLADRSVFLSASVPSPERAERYRRVEDAHLEIEEAVVSLARAVFVEGGTLVFGGHPTISPLVAMVAGEYITPRLADERKEEVRTPIHIYQSEAYKGFVPDETLMMFRAGYATLHWTEAVDGERFDPKAPRDRPRCPKSLRHMRERMIRETAPVAMACIGGMEGVEEEADIFRELRQAAPIYVFGETGGAAALLAERRGDETLRVIDREVLARVAPLRRSRAQGQKSAAAQPEKPPVPYPLIAQMLVAELVSLDDHRRR